LSYLIIVLEYYKMNNNITTDRIVLNVINKLNNRSKIGIDKYGTTLENNNLELKQWLIHLQEELMDSCNYIEKLLIELELEK